jgi:hypothetical protein
MALTKLGDARIQIRPVIADNGTRHPGLGDGPVKLLIDYVAIGLLDGHQFNRLHVFVAETLTDRW